ncbi:MAG: hypothetical protein IJ752_04095 [Alphaproteobacteria bacterium]|nr:hypothetical protein [Alphaproteobacteria bacterium]
MWDWSGSKMPPPPARSRGEAAEDAQNQGVTPVRRDIRPVPIYKDARSFRTLPPTAPASAYSDTLEGQDSSVAASTLYPQRIPPAYQRSAAPPQAPQPYAPQPYAPQAPQYTPAYQQPAQPYAPQPYTPQAPQPYTPAYQQPAQPYAPQPYAPQAPQPYTPAYQQPAQPYAPQPYAPQAPQPYTPAYQQPAQPYAPQSSYAPQAQQASVPSQEDKALWEWQFQQTGLINMDLIEVDYVPLDPNWLAELRKAFKRTRRDFLKYVGYHHVNELLAAGMSEEAIKLVKKGKAPENFNIHIRVPFDYGGTNSFSNLVLIQTHPFHTEIHRFIDMQTLTQPNFKPRKLFLPAPKGKVYFSGEIEISSGGTSRHDRSVYAGFLESTFEMIAQRSVFGR